MPLVTAQSQEKQTLHSNWKKLQQTIQNKLNSSFKEGKPHQNGQNLVKDEPVHDQGYIQSCREPESTANATGEAEQSASTLLDVAQQQVSQ